MWLGPDYYFGLSRIVKWALTRPAHTRPAQTLSAVRIFSIIGHLRHSVKMRGRGRAVAVKSHSLYRMTLVATRRSIRLSERHRVRATAHEGAGRCIYKRGPVSRLAPDIWSTIAIL